MEIIKSFSPSLNTPDAAQQHAPRLTGNATQHNATHLHTQNTTRTTHRVDDIEHKTHDNARQCKTHEKKWNAWQLNKRQHSTVQDNTERMNNTTWADQHEAHGRV